MQQQEQEKISVFHVEELSRGDVGGVYEVQSFSSEIILLRISAGEIEIKGKNLEIKSFNTDVGNLSFVGDVEQIRLVQKKESFWKKVGR